jgi:hypothetical protein
MDDDAASESSSSMRDYEGRDDDLSFVDKSKAVLL